MPKNWKAIAAGLNAQIPERDMEKIEASLNSLDSAFQPLLDNLPHHTEPAVMFQCQPEESR
jgi:hypothetical protein